MTPTRATYTNPDFTALDIEQLTGTIIIRKGNDMVEVSYAHLRWIIEVLETIAMNTPTPTDGGNNG